jgi:hypothetical protein
MSIIDHILNPNHLDHLPLNGWGHQFEDIPAVPFSARQALQSLTKLAGREEQVKQAKSALSNTYTIGDRSATGYQFMYQESDEMETHASDARRDRLNSTIKNIANIGKEIVSEVFHLSHEEPDGDPNLLTSLSLDDPEQWTMSWTTFPNVYRAGEDRLSTWISTLTNADEATEQFWPTIALNGLAYNMLLLQKVGDAQIDSLKERFKSVWSDEWDDLHQAGKLYVIDLSIFEVLEPHKAKGFERFTPSTITLLKQDADKAITPLAIRVAGYEDAGAQIYTRRDNAWLYALQAAKTSVTVYGIWLGHVYHWHIVSAAMQMTMYNTLPTDHAIYKLLAPQSQYLVGFDTVLLALWNELAPPTSINSGHEFLKLCNAFANGRDYFDDDPKRTLDRLDLDQADFTQDEAWDLYPIVPHYLKIWDATAEYVKIFVEESYRDDSAIVGDKKLQEWMKLSADKDGGNIRGLPKMDSKQALKKVLTNLIYRVTMHGASRLNSDAMPALTFVANYPPCLQDSAIPEPDREFDTKELLAYLPKTGAIGGMIDFYFVFIFSAPYEPFVPLDGIGSNLFFDDPSDPRNQALIAYREKVIEATRLIEERPRIHQWPLNVET